MSCAVLGANLHPIGGFSQPMDVDQLAFLGRYVLRTGLAASQSIRLICLPKSQLFLWLLLFFFLLERRYRTAVCLSLFLVAYTLLSQGS